MRGMKESFSIVCGINNALRYSRVRSLSEVSIKAVRSLFSACSRKAQHSVATVTNSIVPT